MLSGEIGDNGFAGSIGAHGSRGPTGAHGLDGPTGSSGSKGGRSWHDHNEYFIIQSYGTS